MYIEKTDGATKVMILFTVLEFILIVKNFKNMNTVIATIIMQVNSLKADKKYIILVYNVGIIFASTDNVINIKVNITASKTYFTSQYASEHGALHPGLTAARPSGIR